MISMRKLTPIPLFMPRFHLSSTKMVGMEVRIKQKQRTLSASETFKLIESGEAKKLLKDINLRFLQWSEKTGDQLYLSWALSGGTSPHELKSFLNELSMFLPLNRMEMVLDAENLTAQASIINARILFEGFQEKGIRSGLFHSAPLDFNTDDICDSVNLFKLKRGVILQMQNDLSVATLGHDFIRKLKEGNVDIVVDNLYSKLDVTNTILIGAGYGQGYFLSRNYTQEKTINPQSLNRIEATNLFDDSSDNSTDLLWI